MPCKHAGFSTPASHPRQDPGRHQKSRLGIGLRLGIVMALTRLLAGFSLQHLTTRPLDESWQKCPPGAGKRAFEMKKSKNGRHLAK